MRCNFKTRLKQLELLSFWSPEHLFGNMCDPKSKPLWGGGGGSGLFTPGKKHLVFGRNKSESLVTAMLAEKWSFQSLPCVSELFIDHQVHMICVSFIY